MENVFGWMENVFYWMNSIFGWMENKPQEWFMYFFIMVVSLLIIVQIILIWFDITATNIKLSSNKDLIVNHTVTVNNGSTK